MTFVILQMVKEYTTVIVHRKNTNAWTNNKVESIDKQINKISDATRGYLGGLANSE